MFIYFNWIYVWQYQFGCTHHRINKQVVTFNFIYLLSFISVTSYSNLKVISPIIFEHNCEPISLVTKLKVRPEL